MLSPDVLGLPVEELEQIAAAGWPGTETARLGDWWLRAGHGFTGRANSALLAGDPGIPLAEALAFVERFYRERNLPAQLQVPELPGDTSSQAERLGELNARLDSLGWIRHNAAWVMAAPLERLLVAGPHESGLPTVVLDPIPSPAWLSGYYYRGNPLPPLAVKVVAAGAHPIFATLTESRDVLGVARGAVSRGWLGITAVTVAERHRRRGVARALMSELARWASDLDATRVYLQVDVDNRVALGMYDRLGFVRHHQYHYRRRG